MLTEKFRNEMKSFFGNHADATLLEMAAQRIRDMEDAGKLMMRVLFKEGRAVPAEAIAFDSPHSWQKWYNDRFGPLAQKIELARRATATADLHKQRAAWNAVAEQAAEENNQEVFNKAACFLKIYDEIQG